MQPDDTAAATGDLIGQIQDNARKLGLTWQIVKATAVDVTDPTAITAIVDGDTIPIGVISILNAPPASGDRVWVMIVPPGGNYLIGVVSGTGPRGPVQFTSSIVDSPSLTTLGVVALTAAASVTFYAGRAYRCRVAGSMSGSATTVALVLQIRVGATLLAQIGAWSQPGTFFGHLDGEQVFTVGATNQTGTVTATGLTSAGTAIWRGAATVPRWLLIEDIGTAAEFNNVAPI